MHTFMKGEAFYNLLFVVTFGIYRITYTCPTGYVIENPYGNYNEQPNPIPKEQVIIFIATFANVTQYCNNLCF